MRQYIGARYTTKIYQNSQNPGSCEWESGVVYEPLTIVSYQNSSYLSRMEVPANAGNPATAPQYWAQTGFYNGQIAHLQDEINSILDTTIPNLIDDINDYNLDNRRFLFVGDSYIAAHANTCVEKACSYLGIPTDHYYNISHAGDSFSNDRFKNQIVNYNGSIARGDITDIFVIGGLNDSLYDSPSGLVPLTGKIREFVTYANTNYPNAHITICFCGGALDYAAGADLEGKTYIKRTWTKYIYQEAERLGCTVRTNMNYPLIAFATNFDEDGIHPNGYGQDALALPLTEYIKGHGFSYILPEYKDTLTAEVGGELYTCIHDNLVTMTLNETMFAIADQNWGSSATYKKIHTMPSTFYVNKEVHLKGDIILYGSNLGTFVMCPDGDVYLRNNDMYLAPRIMKADHSGWENLTMSDTKVILANMHAEFPTDWL